MNQEVVPPFREIEGFTVPQPPSISSSTSLLLNLPPCCVEFSPTNPKFFVVGTYHLEKSPEPDDQGNGVQKRSGSVELFSLEGYEMYDFQMHAFYVARTCLIKRFLHDVCISSSKPNV